VIRFDEASERLERYIRYMAHKLSKTYSGASRVMLFPAMDSDDFYQMGQLKLLELINDTRYQDKPIPEFDAIFKRSLFNHFMDMYKQFSLETTAVVQIELDEESEMWGYDAFAEKYLRFYQLHLESIVSQDAAVLLDYLLFPTPAVYHVHNIQRMRREALRMQGFKVHMPPDKLTPFSVGRSLGLNKNRTSQLLRELRDAWTNHFQTPRFRPNAATI
jgi:hypothetical protein